MAISNCKICGHSARMIDYGDNDMPDYSAECMNIKCQRQGPKHGSDYDAVRAAWNAYNPLPGFITPAKDAPIKEGGQ